MIIEGDQVTILIGAHLVTPEMYLTDIESEAILVTEGSDGRNYQGKSTDNSFRNSSITRQGDSEQIKRITDARQITI